MKPSSEDKDEDEILIPFALRASLVQAGSIVSTLLLLTAIEFYFSTLYRSKMVSHCDDRTKSCRANVI